MTSLKDEHSIIRMYQIKRIGTLNHRWMPNIKRSTDPESWMPEQAADLNKTPRKLNPVTADKKNMECNVGDMMVTWLDNEAKGKFN